MSAFDDERRSGIDRRSEWQDPRLDDLAALVHSNDKKLDKVSILVSAHDLQLIESDRRARQKSDRNWAMTIGMVTVSFGQIATIVTLIVEHGAK